MPELPEVERARLALRPAMEGSRFVRVMTRRAGLRSAFPTDFAVRLEGHTVRTLERRAKSLIAHLSSGEALVMHLGMSGSFRISRQPVASFQAHDHVVFEMSGATVVFNDPRRFGSMRVVADAAADPALTALGPEPLAAAFSARTLAAALAGRRTSIKAALLDQRVVAGLGNIYAAEALHRSRQSPRRRASTLVSRSGAPKPEAVRLAKAIRAVLTMAIGLAADDDDRFQVYGREGLRCRRRGCTGRIRRVVQAGRSTFYCPVCQR